MYSTGALFFSWHKPRPGTTGGKAYMISHTCRYNACSRLVSSHVSTRRRQPRKSDESEASVPGMRRRGGGYGQRRKKDRQKHETATSSPHDIDCLVLAV